MTELFTPRPEDHFTFGLWTVGNPGRDPFGTEVRAPLDPVDSVHRLAELGAYGVSFHDNDLVPYGSSANERDDIVKRFRRALDETGMHVPMVTTNLFWRPVFKEGAFTANDPQIRRLSVKKACEAVELGGELGADVFVLWGGREGMEAEAAKDVRLALDRYKEAIDLVCEHIVARGLRLRIALEPKPNEPRGDILLPTVGHALAFIGTLERPEMVGLNPEFAHETMSGLSFSQAVAQALWQDKLFHIDLNAQRIGKFDQDFRFGSEGIRDAFYVVKLLEDSGWEGMRHFDAHPYRTEDADGVWDFARGCMRTYLILADKARRFHEDAGDPRGPPGGQGGRSWPSRRLRPAASTNCWRPPTTRTRWPRRATATNAWTSSSPNCCSGPASAPGGRGRLVHVRLQGPGARRRYRCRRGVGPSGAPSHFPTAQRAASVGVGARVPCGLRRGGAPRQRDAGCHFDRRAAARARRPRRRRRGPASRQALERHGIRAGHRHAPGRAPGRSGGLGHRVRERPAPELHDRQAALAPPLRARDLPACRDRPVAARLAHLPAHGPADHRSGRRLGNGILVAARSPLPRRPPSPRQRRRRLGGGAPRGARTRRHRRGVARRGDHRWPPGRATTWRPPSASASARATSR